MHFMCESCKASLNIADEKVKGKRLVVRCKRCGSRIQIADPALGLAAILLGPQEGPAAARMTPGVAAQTARSPLGASGHGPGPGPARFARAAPRTAPVAAPAATSFAPRREPAREAFSEDDNESTRAMDSEVLEKALRASQLAEAKPASAIRRDAPRPAPSAASPAAGFFAPPSERAVPEPAAWFAMIAGKQVGPLSPEGLDVQVAVGALGPRSYVWTEGMAGWVRAREVPHLAALFGPPPPAAQPASPPPRPAASSPAPAPLRHKPDARVGPAWSRTEPALASRSSALDSRSPALDSRTSPFDFGRTEPLSEPVPEAPARAISGPAGQNAKQNAAPNVAQNAAQHDEPSPDLELDLDSYDPAAELDSSERAEAHGSEGHAEEPRARAPRAAPEDRAASNPFAQERAAPAAQLPAERPVRDELEDLPLLELDQPSEQTPAQDPALQPDTLSPEEVTTALVVHPRAALPWLAAARWIKDKARRLLAHPLLLAALGAVLGLVLLVVLPVKSKAPQKASPAPAQEVRAAPPKDGVPGGQARATAPAVETPIVLGGQGSPAAGSDAPALAPAPGRDPGTAPLTADDVKKKLDENKGSLQRCIDEALRRDPRDPALRAGRIRITTTIAPSGAVIGAKIDKRGVDESALGACLKGATGRIVFPPFPGKPVDVDIPIVVTAGN
jgi:predicted Zn finger-like uncharacterized protein